MPSRRRAFPIVLAACWPGLGVLVGCSPRDGLLASRADIEVSGQPGARPPADIPIVCRAGQTWLARLEQHDFDARLELRDAAGTVLAAVAGPSRGGGREYLFREPAKGEAASLRVVAVSPAPSTANYRIQVYCLASPSPADVAGALRAMTVAGDPGRSADRGRRDKAVTQYEDAERVWIRRDELRLAADVALQLAGLQYYERQDWRQALMAARRVTSGSGASRDPELRADARLLEGATDLELARGGLTVNNGGKGEIGGVTVDPWADAVAALREAQDLYRRADKRASAAQAQIYLAGGFYDRGDFDAAVSGYESAANTLRAVNATADEARVARNLAAVRFDRGDFVGAARAYESILAKMPSTPNSGRASALQNMAVAYAAIGEFERALVAFRESLDVGTALSDDDLVARALAGLGVNHARLGHRDLGVTYLRDAVALSRRIGQQESLARGLLQLGDVYLQRHDLMNAEAAHREAIELIGPGAAPSLRARSWLALGTDQAAAGQHASAISTFSRALGALSPQSHSLVARTLVARATSRRFIGALAVAQADAEQAVMLARANGDREALIAALIEAAQVSIGRGDPALALRAADAAVSEIERLPTGAANPDNRLTLRARLRLAYELRVQLLAEDAMRAQARGDDERAGFRRLEALRATIGGVASQPLVGVPPHGAHGGADALEDTYTRLAARRYRLEALAERNLKPSPTMRALEREVALLRTQLATSPESGSKNLLSRPERSIVPPATVAKLGAPVDLSSDVAVITYWLGATRSWAWIVTRGGVEMYALPPRATIDATVARLLRRIRAVGSGTATTASAMEALERLVLPLPRTGGWSPHWRVVPDGSLGAVPWPLIAGRHGIESVSLLPSAGSLFTRIPEPAKSARAGALRIALFGDPIFGADDARISARGAARTPHRVATMRASDVDPRELARLPGTGVELAAIAHLAGDAIVVQAIGLEATRTALLQLPPGRVDVLHVATHATIDAEIPDLAALVMTRIDAAGNSQSGNVRAHDILGMRAAPDLVVLSACDAAAEPAGSAEGRMNLVRAFLANGARHVVASLWETSDASAVELMTQFYDGLLLRGLDPEAALARAQNALASSERWRAPFYWAGFVVTRASP